MSQKGNKQYSEVVLSGSMAELRKLRVDYEVVSSNPNSYILARGNLRADKTGSVGGPLFVTGNFIVGNPNNLETSSTAVIAGDLTVGNEQIKLHSSARIAGKVNVSGSGAVTGSFNIGENLFVSKSTKIKNNLTVETGNVEIDGGYLAVKKDITGEGNLYITGAAKVGQNLDVRGSETIQGSSSIGKTLTVGERATFKEDVQIWDTLGVGGQTAISGNIIIGDSGSLVSASTATIAGNVSIGNEKIKLSSSLKVAGQTNISGSGAVTGSFNIGENLFVSKSTKIKNNLTVETGDVQVTGGEVQVKGTITGEGDLNISGSSKIRLSSEIGGNLTVEGSEIIQGSSSIERTLNVGEDATFKSNVQIQEDLQVLGDVDIDGRLDLGEDLEVQGSLKVHGTSSLEGTTVIGDDLVVEGNLTVRGETTTLDVKNLTVEDKLIEIATGATSRSEINGAGIISLSGSNNNVFVTYSAGKEQLQTNVGFLVSGIVDLEDNLTVGKDELVRGSETIQGSSSIGKTLTVGERATFKEDVQVWNDLGVGGNLAVSGGAVIGDVQDPGSTSSVKIAGNLEIGNEQVGLSSSLKVAGKVNISGSGAVTGSFSVLEDFEVSGNTALQGNLDIGGNVDITQGDLHVSGDIENTGDHIVGQNVEIGNNLKITGTQIDAGTVQNFVLSGSSIKNGTLHVDNNIEANGFEVEEGNVTIQGTSTVYGQSIVEDNQIVRGNLTVTGSTTIQKGLSIGTELEVPTGSLGYITSSELHITREDGRGSAYVDFYYGDGRYLQNVSASIITSSKVVVPFDFPGATGGNVDIQHGYNTPNVVAVVYRQDIDTEGQTITTQTSAAVRVVDANTVNIAVTSSCKGYVVVLNAGQMITGSIDLMEYATYEDSYDQPAWTSRVFEHRLGTRNVIVSTYREGIVEGELVLEQIIPENTIVRDENHVEIVFNQDSKGYVVIGKAGHIVKNVDLVESCVSQSYVTVGDITGTYPVYHGFGTDSVVVDTYKVNGLKKTSTTGVVTTIEDENHVSFKFPETGEYFIVISKGGHIVSGTVDLHGNEIHYGDTGSWSANSYTCYESMSTKVVKASEHVDTPKVGNLDAIEGYYGPEHSWGSFTAYEDYGITNYISPQRGEPASEENVRSKVSFLDNGGNLHLRGGLYPGEIFTSSDKRLKKDVKSIEKALEGVQQLRGVDFVWRESGKESKGFIAQEVQEVYPELVSRVQDLDGRARLAIDPVGILGVLLEAVKELSNKVDKLEQQSKIKNIS